MRRHKLAAPAVRGTNSQWVTLPALALLVSACGGSSSQTSDQTLPVYLSVPERGEQLSIGPFDVPSGTEVQICRTLKMSNTEAVGVNRLQVSLAQGSHHFILFRSNKDFPDEVFPCWGTVNFDDWEFMIDVNKSGGEDWQLADGQAFVLQPNQQIMIQSHFVNATTVQSPKGGMALVNMFEVDPNVAHPLHGMFTVDTRINIPPHSAYTTSRACTFDQTVYLAAMTGHFHARGLEFSVNRFRDNVLMPEQIYDSKSWDSPNFEIFPQPSDVFNTFDDGVEFTCSYFNNTDNTIGWGGHADVQEHCNLFFQYYFYNESDPKNKPMTCKEGSGGW